MLNAKCVFCRGIVGILVVAILGINACSFSYSSKSSSASSESSSKIVSSPFTSISGSSSPKDKAKQYKNDVEDYTSAYVRSSGGDYSRFRKQLSDLANQYGVTHWEAQPITYIAIGRGLKKAGIKGIEYETFKKNFAAGEYSKMQDIQEGYESRK